MSPGLFILVALRGRRVAAVIGVGVVLAWLAAAPTAATRPIEELPMPTVSGWFPLMTPPLLWPHWFRR